MSTIQNLKNFIRHGKQARAADAPRDQPTTNLSPVHAHHQLPQPQAQQQQPQHQHQQQRHHVPAISEPNQGHQNNHAQQPQPVPGEYSAAAVDQRNVAAQAGHAAAHLAGHGQNIQNAGRDRGQDRGRDRERERERERDAKATREAREAELLQIVNEEREQKGKMPKYPGLERYILLEKMGDGAFSNVFRAKDTTTQLEVAIKVVRKYEMSAAQVWFMPHHQEVFSFLVSCLSVGAAGEVVSRQPSKHLANIYLT